MFFRLWPPSTKLTRVGYGRCLQECKWRPGYVSQNPGTTPHNPICCGGLRKPLIPLGATPYDTTTRGCRTSSKLHTMVNTTICHPGHVSERRKPRQHHYCCSTRKPRRGYDAATNTIQTSRRWAAIFGETSAGRVQHHPKRTSVMHPTNHIS